MRNRSHDKIIIAWHYKGKLFKSKFIFLVIKGENGNEMAINIIIE